MHSTGPPLLSHPDGDQRLPGRSIVLAVLVGLLLAILGCGFGSSTATPTPIVVPPPAPRPTAEPPAAVGGWYLAAQAGPEEPVRIRAALTAREVEALTKELDRRYPKLVIEWSRGSDADLFQTTIDEIRAGTPAWDIYIGDSGPSLKTARVAMRWTPPEGRGVQPQLFDAEGSWYALAATYYVTQFNTVQVPPAYVPRTYEALLHAGYFGRLAIEEQQVTWLRGLIAARGQESAETLIRGLAQQGVTFRRDTRSLVAFVTAGEQAVAITARMDAVEREFQAGGMTGWVGIEPVIVQPLAMVVSAATDRPNSARVVANFLLSLDAQMILADNGRVPTRTDIELEPQSPVRGLRTQVVLPPEGVADRDLRVLWAKLWGRR